MAYPIANIPLRPSALTAPSSSALIRRTDASQRAGERASSLTNSPQKTSQSSGRIGSENRVDAPPVSDKKESRGLWDRLLSQITYTPPPNIFSGDELVPTARASVCRAFNDSDLPQTATQALKDFSYTYLAGPYYRGERGTPLTYFFTIDPSVANDDAANIRFVAQVMQYATGRPFIELKETSRQNCVVNDICATKFFTENIPGVGGSYHPDPTEPSIGLRTGVTIREILHEVQHNLGLPHPGDATGTNKNYNYLKTLMSYIAATRIQTPQKLFGGFQVGAFSVESVKDIVTPMPLDLLQIRNMYTLSPSNHTRNLPGLAPGYAASYLGSGGEVLVQQGKPDFGYSFAVLHPSFPKVGLINAELGYRSIVSLNPGDQSLASGQLMAMPYFTSFTRLTGTADREILVGNRFSQSHIVGGKEGADMIILGPCGGTVEGMGIIVPNGDSTVRLTGKSILVLGEGETNVKVEGFVPGRDQIHVFGSSHYRYGPDGDGSALVLTDNTRCLLVDIQPSQLKQGVFTESLPVSVLTYESEESNEKSNVNSAITAGVACGVLFIAVGSFCYIFECLPKCRRTAGSGHDGQPALPQPQNQPQTVAPAPQPEVAVQMALPREIETGIVNFHDDLM